MAQFFRGNLAGLMIRSGRLENKKVIDCLYTCKEGLDVQLPEEVASAVKVREASCFKDPNTLKLSQVESKYICASRIRSDSVIPKLLGL